MGRWCCKELASERYIAGLTPIEKIVHSKSYPTDRTSGRCEASL